MDFSLTEIEDMLLESASTFAGRCLAPAERTHEKAGAPADSVLKAWQECGLSMLAGSGEELEVSGPGRVAVLRTLGACDGATTLALWLPAMAQAAAEKLGADAGGSVITSMVLEGDIESMEWPRPCVPLCGGDHILVLDRAGNWGVAKVSHEPVLAIGLRSSQPARAALEQWIVRGTAEPVVADVVRAETRLSAAALMVGIARASCDYVAGYLPERVAFGKALSQHQGLAFLFAEMAMAVTSVELLVSKAAWDLDQGRPQAAVGAWLEAREAALMVTDRGVQLLGGHGYMDDHPVEKWMRDARGLALLFGGEDGARFEAAAGVTI
jgi:alkylation response protein AidB-like acyl-CoA dehydrogenase